MEWSVKYVFRYKDEYIVIAYNPKQKDVDRREGHRIWIGPLDDLKEWTFEVYDIYRDGGTEEWDKENADETEFIRKPANPFLQNKPRPHPLYKKRIDDKKYQLFEL